MPTKKLDHDSYIYERISDDGRLTGYQVKIRRAGFPDFTKTFDDLAEARTAVNRVLADQSRGHRFNPLLAERKTLGDVIRAALEALKNGERVVKGRTEEISRLRGFLLRETALCAHAMAHIDYEMMEDWKQQRLEEVSAGTVKRELTQLRGIFADAARKLHLVCSPLIHVKSPTVMDERVARFKLGEEGRLFAALAQADHPVVLPAAAFALDSGCRRGELLRIMKADYQRQNSTVYLHDAKNGRGRHILLTGRAQQIVEDQIRGDSTGAIFQIDAHTLRRHFEIAREQVDMRHWRWHDFRHEAISRLFDLGWTIPQVMDFSGHVDPKSLLRYRHADVSRSVELLRDAERQRNGHKPMHVVR